MSNITRCPECDKAILFGDDMDKHCLINHGHSFDYLKGYNAAVAAMDEVVKKMTDLKGSYKL